MRTSEQQLLALIAKSEPVDSGDLERLAERDGLELNVERTLAALLADGKVVADAAGDIRRIPQRAKARGLSADQIHADSRRRADRARRVEQASLAAYRGEYLGGEILPRREITAWIEDRGDTPTDYETLAGGEVVSRERRVLEYDNGSGWSVGIETTHGGPLERLRELSERLAQTYGWQPAQAVSFVLADASPVLAGIRLRTVRSFGSVRREDVQVAAVHERQEPEAVAAAVRRARRREGSAQRRPDDRQGALADFMLGRSAGEESRLEWWRYCHELGRSEWAYGNRSAFHVAVQRARRAYPDAA